MKPADFLELVLDPGLALFQRFTGMAPTDQARVQLMAIAGQESRWLDRLQVPVPYARSYFQFEKLGGVAGVLAHAASREMIRKVCAGLDIPCDVATVYEAMAWSDPLAVAMARLLLWTDPAPLPAVGDVDTGWEYYRRNWRPGRPHPEVWPERYATALSLIKPQ